MDYAGYDGEDTVLEEIERREARKDAISAEKRYQKQRLIDDTADCLPGIGRSCSKKYNKLKNKVSSFFKPNTNTGGRKICKNNKRTCKKYRKSKRNKKNNKRK
jgi:hypothetical protein